MTEDSVKTERKAVAANLDRIVRDPGRVDPLATRIRSSLGEPMPVLKAIAPDLADDDLEELWDNVPV